MYTVRQLLQENSNTDPWSVSPQSTVLEGLKLMSEKNVGAILVVDKGQMVGIFSERDFARRAIERGKCTLESPIADNMTSDMVTIDIEKSLEDALALMAKYHIRHLPVIENGRLVGMVSMRDVMEAIISKKDTTIESLESYIEGKEYPR